MEQVITGRYASLPPSCSKCMIATRMALIINVDRFTMRTWFRSVHCVVSTGEMMTAKVLFSHVRCSYLLCSEWAFLFLVLFPLLHTGTVTGNSLCIWSLMWNVVRAVPRVKWLSSESSLMTMHVWSDKANPSYTRKADVAETPLTNYTPYLRVALCIRCQWENKSLCVMLSTALLGSEFCIFIIHLHIWKFSKTSHSLHFTGTYTWSHPSWCDFLYIANQSTFMWHKVQIDHLAYSIYFPLCSCFHME